MGEGFGSLAGGNRVQAWSVFAERGEEYFRVVGGDCLIGNDGGAKVGELVFREDGSGVREEAVFDDDWI